MNRTSGMIMNLVDTFYECECYPVINKTNKTYRNVATISAKKS